MSDFSECEQFRDVPHQYQNCRHERLTPELCDKWRVNMGLDPLAPKKPSHGMFIPVRSLAEANAIINRRAAEGASNLQSAPKTQKKLTLMEKAVSVAKAAADVAVNGFHPLNEQQIQERLAICQTCEYFARDHCKLCGCGLSDKVSLTNKIAHPNQQCPHNPPKWGKVAQ